MFLLALLATTAFGSKVETKKGTKEVGGTITGNIANVGGSTGFILDASPTMGVFLRHRLQLFGDVHIGLASFEGSATTYGVGIGTRYLFKNKEYDFYVGARAGIGGASGGGSVGIDVAPMGGVWIPMNKRVVIDLGARANININSGNTSWAIPFGYTGIHGFFR